MFGKKAKEIKELSKDLADQRDGNIRLAARCCALEEEIASLKAANADQAQKLKNAEVLLQREQAATEQQRKRADENYQSMKLIEQERDAMRAPFTQEVLAQAAPKPKKPSKK